MTRPLDGRSYATLVFEGVARNATGQDFALLIDKLQEKIRILVVYVLDAIAAETAILFLALANIGVAQKLYLISGCHDLLVLE